MSKGGKGIAIHPAERTVREPVFYTVCPGSDTGLYRGISTTDFRAEPFNDIMSESRECVRVHPSERRISEPILYTTGPCHDRVFDRGISTAYLLTEPHNNVVSKGLESGHVHPAKRTVREPVFDVSSPGDNHALNGSVGGTNLVLKAADNITSQFLEVLHQPLAVLPLGKPLNDFPGPLLDLGTDSGKKVQSFQESFHNVLPHLTHDRGGAMDTKTVLEPLDKRVKHVFLNPGSNVLDTVPDTQQQALDDFNAAELSVTVLVLDILQKVVLNVSNHVRNECSDKTDTRTQGRPQQPEERLSDTSEVQTHKAVLDTIVNVVGQLTPINLFQPIGSFVQSTLDEIANALSYQPPIQVFNQANQNIREGGQNLHNRPAQHFTVNDTQGIVDTRGNVLSEPGKIPHLFKPFIGFTDSPLDSVTHRSPQQGPVQSIHQANKNVQTRREGTHQ